MELLSMYWVCEGIKISEYFLSGIFFFFKGVRKTPLHYMLIQPLMNVSFPSKLPDIQ